MEIRPHINPKGIALVVSSLLNAGKGEAEKETIIQLLDWLKNHKSHFYDDYCWGHPFDWQARAFFQPRDMPTVVATSFVGQTFLDAYDYYQKKEYLTIAESAGLFMMNHLNRTPVDDGFAFSYSPEDQSVVFNATALGSRHLARCYAHNKKQEFADTAVNSIKPLLTYQNSDGSWAYGLQSHHTWIDNFHTGYNLECLHGVMSYLNLETEAYQKTFDHGMTYYIDTFFKSDGLPMYYSDSDYPVDSHAPAQLFATLYKTGLLGKYSKVADTVFEWWINNLYSFQEKAILLPKKQVYNDKNRLYEMDSMLVAVRYFLLFK